jgi:ADP-dependent NAD(P)H-hydrate dehydratase / NAD(P)H-hydrate epimerase
MDRAGAAAAAEIAIRHSHALPRGVLVLAGPGNNGGDGWVVARALAQSGADVRVIAPAGAKSEDCIAERGLARPSVTDVPWTLNAVYSGEGIVVDALLGTGASGAMSGEIATAVKVLEIARQRGAIIVAVDLPSGLDATTGETNGAVRADTTITFGSIKRGHLVARGTCGTIVVVDIGLKDDARHATFLTDGWNVAAHLPRIDVSAHKGMRKKLVLHGGAPAMAGAVILGLRAALRSGIGMVKAMVHPSSVDAVHIAVPAALVEAWPAIDDVSHDEWADVLVIGPGLGRTGETRRAVESATRRFRGPLLLDADALAVFDGDLDGLRAVVGTGGRAVLITPHIVEMARLVGESPETVLERRFEIGAVVARKTGATVLLKGVPTIVSSPDGSQVVVAAGTPALATGGSGDVLTGIAGTLLAQMADAPRAAASIAAWIHGRAAELTGPRVRGTTLDDVLEMLPHAWSIDAAPPRYPIVAELPAVTSQ